jgi:hypothetical protein
LPSEDQQRDVNAGGRRCGTFPTSHSRLTVLAT